MYQLWEDTAKELQGEEHVKRMENAGLGGEDFSFFAEQVPGIYYWLGSRTPGTKSLPVHNEHYCPDTDCFLVGERVMVNMALKYLAGY